MEAVKEAPAKGGFNPPKHEIDAFGGFQLVHTLRGFAVAVEVAVLIFL